MLSKLMQPLRQKQGQQGYVLLLMLVTSMALFVALSGILSLSITNLASIKRTVFDTSALYAAESGVDNAVYQLTVTNGTYTGSGTANCPMTDNSGAVEVFNDAVKGRGTYQVCVQPGSIAHEFNVYVAGKVYPPGGGANPVSTRKLKVVAEGSPSGSYAVQTGPGGMIMSNSANISQGPIYIGGYLTMNNTASIGTPSVPVAVSVANYRCPADGSGSWPSECTGNTWPNPITINSSQAHIYGTVNANEQTNPYTTQMTNPGLQATSGVAAPTLPGYDRVAQVNAVTATINASSATCGGSSGTITWPANVKIVGDVLIKNSCTVIVTGNAWITGSFTMRNSSVIKVAEGVSSQPTIMVDGAAGVTTQQTSSVATNSSQVGMEFITFYSTNSCSTATTSGAYCDSMNGATYGSSLFNSQGITTISIGNQGAAAGSVFYAKYTKVTLGQAGSIGALLGQTIELGQSGNLVFTTTVVTGNYSYDVRYYDFANW